MSFSKSGPVFSELRNLGWNQQTVANISSVPKISGPLGLPRINMQPQSQGNQKWEILQGGGWGGVRYRETAESENRSRKHRKWKTRWNGKTWIFSWRDVSAHVLVCLDCSSKRTTVWVAETAGMSCLTDLEARSARPTWAQGGFLPRAAWRICSGFSVHSWWLAGHLWYPLSWTSPQSLPSPHVVFSLHVCLCQIYSLYGHQLHKIRSL